MSERRKRLFVSNIDFEVTTEQLRTMFEEIGSCLSVVIATDRDTKKSRGFAFIEMEQEDDAERVVKELNERNVNGRPMKVAFDKGKVNEERSEESRPEFLPPIQRVQIFRRNRRVDPFMADPAKSVDYKEIALLKSYTTEKGKIMPRKYTGLSAYNQRKVSKAIKRAQNLGLLPTTR